MANILDGRDLCLFVKTGSTYKCVALATSAKISLSMSTREISSKDSGFAKEIVAGQTSWSCDTESLYTEDFNNFAPTQSGWTFKTLYDSFLTRTPVFINFAVVATPGLSNPLQQTVGTGYRLEGQCYITKLDVTAKNNDNVTFSASFEGTGQLTQTKS